MTSTPTPAANVRASRACAALNRFAIASMLLTASAATAADAAQAFRSACGPCHSSNLGHRIGPSLVGVGGRISGTAAGFEYSNAMKEAAVRWDADTLNRFLSAPARMIAGSRMSYPGLKDEARRGEIVGYILGLRSD